MKRNIYLFTLIILFCLSIVAFSRIPPADALETTGSANLTSSPSASPTKLLALRQKISMEINRRLAALQNVNNLFSQINSLSDDQKNILSKQVQDQTALLSSLKTKTASESSYVLLRGNINFLTDSYDDFAFYVTKIRVLAAADALDQAASHFNELLAEMQKPDQLAKLRQSSLSDQKLLEDIENKIADAKTQSQTASKLVLPLKSSGYPANKKTFSDAKKLLDQGKQDLETARQNFGKLLTP